MKVYVVTEGIYSDYSIDKIFTDEHLAKAYVAMKRKRSYHPDEHNIETYDTDDVNIQFTPEDIDRADKEIKMGYRFGITDEGICLDGRDYMIIDNDADRLTGYFAGRDNQVFWIDVIAKDSSDEEYMRCLKVAQDRKAELLANKKHIN